LDKQEKEQIIEGLRLMTKGKKMIEEVANRPLFENNLKAEQFIMKGQKTTKQPYTNKR
jgi:hypothetical protein